jgi:hypothetical protein
MATGPYLKEARSFSTGSALTTILLSFRKSGLTHLSQYHLLDTAAWINIAQCKSLGEKEESFGFQSS